MCMLMRAIQKTLSAAFVTVCTFIQYSARELRTCVQFPLPAEASPHDMLHYEAGDILHVSNVSALCAFYTAASSTSRPLYPRKVGEVYAKIPAHKEAHTITVAEAFGMPNARSRSMVKRIWERRREKTERCLQLVMDSIQRMEVAYSIRA